MPQPDVATIADLVRVHAAKRPDAIALVVGERIISFAELDARSSQAAQAFRAAGVGTGDRVAFVEKNGVEFFEVTYGLAKLGAVVVPVNWRLAPPEMLQIIDDAGAAVVVVGSEFLGHIEAIADELTSVHTILAVGHHDRWQAFDDWIADQPTDDPGVATGPDDIALQLYTSGTTGLPKGCMHPHRTLMHNAIGGALWGHAGAETVSLGVVPMFHITGMLYGVLGVVHSGSTHILMPRWDRELAGRLISRYGVTHWTCIPTMVIDLFGSPNYKSFDLSSLRYISGGGAAMPHAVAQRLQDEFGLTFAEGYGLTETAAPSHANPPERAKLQCLGIPIFGVDSRVVDPLTMQELPPGEIGEIITRGPMLFKGYWRHPEATKEAFVEFEGKTFFRTGDLGRMDEEGYFFMTDRLKRMINASGYKVWPAEVEMLLYKHPAVQEACIIAARDAYRGETVKAVVVLRAGAKGKTKAEDITAWARENMAAYKVPKIVEFVESLPKSGSGKVMWRLLQDEEAARSAAAG